MRHQIEFLDSTAAAFKSGGKVTVPELFFADIQPRVRAVALRAGQYRISSTRF